MFRYLLWSFSQMKSNMKRSGVCELKLQILDQSDAGQILVTVLHFNEKKKTSEDA